MLVWSLLRFPTYGSGKVGAKYTRSLPKEYIAKNGHDVTQAFIDYAKPIVGDLPKCAIF